MKQVGILGGLLALSLVGAYVSWTSPDAGPSAGDVLVVRASADLRAVTWKDADQTVRLTRKRDAGGAYLWIEATDHPAPADAPDDEGLLADADGGDAAGVDPAPEGRTPRTTAFLGSAQADEVWRAFAPLYALRELEVAPGADLSAYGLDEVDTTIALDLGGRTVSVELGGEAYGVRDRYARVDGKVYLLDDGVVRPLEFAKTRLVERRVFPYDEPELVEVAVRRGADARTFVQRNADDRTRAYWADAATPDARDVEGSAWLGKLFRTRIRSYDVPADLAAQVLFTFEVAGRDGARWPVEVLRADGDEPTYFARSAYTRATVELTRSLTEEAVVDLETLFDGVQPEAADQEEAP